MPRAILSTSNKNGLVDLARGLVTRGYDLISTGGTARILEEAGLPVTGVAEVTGFPELLEGRVKTLHPAVHGGILARRDRPDDLDALARHGIRPIDVVVVNLYPFADAARRRDIAFGDLVEEIDIGGPSLLRAAAKNFRDVLVVVEAADYPRVLEALDRQGGPTPAMRLELAVKAFAHTADYDTTIRATLAEFDAQPDGRIVRRRAPAGPLAAEVTWYLRDPRELRYGENPHQRATLFNSTLEVLQGKALSYTNLLDLDAAHRLVSEFDEPAAVVVKHTNPCGVATGLDAEDAYVRARDADALSAFGGIVGLNRVLDPTTARAITSTFIEAVLAQGVVAEARRILAGKPNLRVVVPLSVRHGADPPAGQFDDMDVRSISGGVLAQEIDRVSEARAPWPQGDFPNVVTRRAPTAEEWAGLRFAWRVSAHVKSNAVVFTSMDRTLAIGAGQMSRVDAVKVAVMKAGGGLTGSVAASDAFFPFRDGLDAIAAAGATAVVQPGGSVRDAEVIAAADEHGLAMVFTGRRHFRH